MRTTATTLALLALCACGAFPPRPPGSAAAPGVAASPSATPALGFDSADLDPARRPQDDFWGYTNGRWLQRTDVPADESSTGIFQDLIRNADARLRAILDSDARGGSDAASQQRGRLYTSFTASAAAGVHPSATAVLREDLAAIQQLRNHEDVMTWFGTALAQGIQVPIGYFIDADANDPSRSIIYFGQDGIGLPDRDYYLLDTPELIRTRTAYAQHINALCAVAELDCGRNPADRLMAIERQLALKQWPAADSQDLPRIARNQFDMDGARRLSPEFHWPGFLRGGGFGTPERMVIAETDYFAALGDIVRNTPVADWQLYLRFKLLKGYAPYLGPAIVAEDFNFQGKLLRGQSENQPVWRRGVQLVSAALGESLGQAYVRRHFAERDRQRVAALVDNLKAEFAAGMAAADWMSVDTRAAAREKLERFVSKIGYPDQWRNYSALDLRADDLSGNVRRIRAFDHAFELAKLGRPVDRAAWLMTPQTVNAYYNPGTNEICFPAGILQPPYYDPAADDAWNYGAIGATIGHEFSHGFDDQGRQFDGDGALRDWWTPADAKEYERRTARLVEQFNAFRPLPDVAINGTLTLGENIADLVGLVMAYRAYQRSLNGKPAPVIAGFTGEQRFFIGYAMSFRGKDRPEKLRSQLLTDPHSPDEYRVTGILQNIPEFYAAFDVRPGDGMYLPPERRTVIW
jgi:putative endopeptidase